jgi:hypothetical protein
MSISVLSRPKLPASSHRPKLSLNTSHLPSPFAHKTSNTRTCLTTDSPTTRNTHDNAFKPSTTLPNLTTSIPTTTSPPSAPPPPTLGLISPSSSTSTSPSIPYTLPLGSHSILRNSSLPARLVYATSARTPKLLFPPRKRVKFSNDEPIVLPTPIISESEEEEEEEDGIRSKKRKVPGLSTKEVEATDNGDEETEVPSTPLVGWRKPPRQWVWTIGVDHDVVEEDEGKYLGKAWKE